MIVLDGPFDLTKFICTKRLGKMVAVATYVASLEPTQEGNWLQSFERKVAEALGVYQVLIP